MQDDKYTLRKQRSLDMLNNGLDPVKNTFNEYFIPSQTERDKMKCWRQGCYNKRLEGCTHYQCQKHHKLLCVEQDYKDTMNGYCQLVSKVRR